MTSKKLSPAPPSLSERSSRLWTEIVRDRVWSPGRLTLFEQALLALDRAEEAKALVDAEGLTTTTKTTGAVHVHPALKIEKDARGQFLQAWGALCLNFDPMVDGRL